MCRILLTYKISQNCVQYFKRSCVDGLLLLHYVHLRLINKFLCSKGQTFKDRKELDFPCNILHFLKSFSMYKKIEWQTDKSKYAPPPTFARYINTYMYLYLFGRRYNIAISGYVPVLYVHFLVYKGSMVGSAVQLENSGWNATKLQRFSYKNLLFKTYKMLIQFWPICHIFLHMHKNNRTTEKTAS